MAELMARNWWMMVLRGIAAILFGLVVFLWPGLALNVLLLLFAAYALIDGLFALGTAWRNRAAEHGNWIAPLLEGLAGLVVAGLTLLYPGLTAVTLLYIIAVWAIITGVFELYAAYHYRKAIQNEAWMGLSGLASIVFGVLLIAYPASGALAVLWMI